jgi:hypothetical protein
VIIVLVKAAYASQEVRLGVPTASDFPPQTGAHFITRTLQRAKPSPAMEMIDVSEKYDLQTSRRTRPGLPCLVRITRRQLKSPKRL